MLTIYQLPDPSLEISFRGGDDSGDGVWFSWVGLAGAESDFSGPAEQNAIRIALVAIGVQYDANGDPSAALRAGMTQGMEISAGQRVMHRQGWNVENKRWQ